MTTTIAGFEIHPIAELFPLIEGEAFDDLVEDVRQNGLRRCIVLLDDKILDGRNRLRACIEAGVEPHFEQLDEGTDALAWVLSENLHRRHLTTSQRAMIAARLLDVERERGRVRQAAAAEFARRKRAEQADEEGDGPGILLPANLPEAEFGDARDKAASTLKVSGRTVEHAATVVATRCEPLIRQVDAGEMAVSRAALLARAHNAADIEVLLAQGKQAVDAALAKLKPGKAAPSESAEAASERGVDRVSVEKTQGFEETQDSSPPEFVAAPSPHLEAPVGDDEVPETPDDAPELPLDESLRADAAKLEKGLQTIWRMVCGPRWAAIQQDDEALARNVRAIVAGGSIKTGIRVEAEVVARLLIILEMVLREQEMGRSKRMVKLVDVGGGR